MPITNIFGRMPLDQVWVKRDERQRRDPDPEGGGLLQSIALWGVLQPVILEEEPDERGYHTLYAGERRYAASLMLGLSDIPFRFARSPSPTEVQIIEFEENAKRRDLTWQETCQSVVKLHALFREEDPSHTFAETGASLGWGDGSNVAKYHYIAEFWQDDAVRGCGTVNEAYNLLQRRQKRAQSNKLEEWLGEPNEVMEKDDDGQLSNSNSTAGVGVGVIVSNDKFSDVENRTETPRSKPNPVAPTPAFPIVQRDFLEWAPTYSGPKFNLIHCDFPYGISLDTSTTKRTGSNSLHREEDELYSDTPADYAALLESFVTNFDRFASESCHVMFWYSNRTEIEVATRHALGRISGFTFLRFPLIWHKSDNAGFMTPGTPRHIYETCLVGGRGDRPIVKYISDVYSAPTDNSLHMSAKPEPMLRYFMGMFCDEHSRVLDPTCGSGSSLRAAEALRAERVLGLELSPEMVRIANTELLRARALRRAAGEGGK
jgi:ParB-like nuclease domain